MKPAKREWALVAAMTLFMVFANFQHPFMRLSSSIEKMTQVNLFSTAGYLLGMLVLPLLLPMEELRSGRRPRISGPAGYARLALICIFFLPNIIVFFLGQQAWLQNPFISAFMAVGNGAAIVLIVGCFFTLFKKDRIFWAALANGAGTFVSALVLGPGRDVLQPYLFTAARIALTLAGVMLFVFLSGVPKFQPSNSHPHPIPQSPLPIPHSLSFLFPILAAFVIFWTNSFTNQIFLPKLYNLFAPGFNMPTVVLLLALPVLGFLADHWWRHFLNVFVHMSSFLFLLAPSLLLFSNSHMLFMILYTLNIIMIQMILVIFPFLVVDMYWQEASSHKEGASSKAERRLAWLMPVSVLMINANAVFLMGPFRSFSLDNAYSVVLLTLAAVAFFLLSRKMITVSLPGSTVTDAVPAISRAESFRAHGLTEREIEAAELILLGLENDKIKEKMFVSLSTVKMHVGAILKKYKLKRRAEFIAMFVKK